MDNFGGLNRWENIGGANRWINSYGGYLPPLDVGFGPAFGGGWGNWSGQVGQTFGPGTMGWQAGQNLTDDQILSLFYDALDNDPMIPSGANIDATVKNKVISVGGEVRSKEIKRRVGHIAYALPGVKDVNNTISIRHRSQQAGQASSPTSSPAGAESTSNAAAATTTRPRATRSKEPAPTASGGSQ